MRSFQCVLFIFITAVFYGQDSLPSQKKFAFSIQLLSGVATRETAPLNQQYVNSFTRDERFHDPSFYAGYSDTTGYRPTIDRHGGDGVYKNTTYGSVTPQIGIACGLTFKTKRSGFIKSISPQLSIFHSKRRFFAYNVRSITTYPVDTVFYADPKYPPIIYDTSSYGNIYYRYTSKQVYMELGVLFALIQRPRYIFEVGARYGIGKSYQNKFYVRREILAETIAEPISTTVYETIEPSSYSNRITVPVSFQINLRRNPKGLWFGADVCPGYETYKIKNGRRSDFAICVFTWRLKYVI